MRNCRKFISCPMKLKNFHETRRRYEQYMARELAVEIPRHRGWIEANRQALGDAIYLRESSRIRRYRRWDACIQRATYYSLFFAWVCLCFVLYVKCVLLASPAVPLLAMVGFTALSMTFWTYPACILANRLHQFRQRHTEQSTGG